MAPGSGHKMKGKSNANKTKQILIDRNSKPADLKTLRGIKGRFDKENVASDGGKSNIEKEPFVILKAHNNSSKGSEHTTKNQTCEINLTPQISIGTAIQRLEIPLTQSPVIPTTENHENPTTESPEIPSNEQAPSTETSIETASSKKRSRGPTMGKGIMKSFVALGSKMKINVDPFIGRPINGDESAKLASQIGVVTRDVLPVPKRWKDVDEEKSLEPGFDHINIHMDVNVDAPGVKQCLIDRLKSSSRQKRYKLHMHYKKFATLVEAKNNKPSCCPCKKNWEALCDYFATPKFKHTSFVNVGNRKQVRAPHISGRKPFTVRRHEISQKELNGDPCDMIDLYKRTHYSEEKGWSSKVAEENWELMKKKQDQYREEGSEKNTDEIVLEVLGHGSGYIKGLGYGPKPPSRRITSSNLATQQVQKELQDTQQKLQMSNSQVNDLKTQVAEFETEVSDLKTQLVDQGANINKLMAFMAAKGMDIY